jgi:hypothetical protein
LRTVDEDSPEIEWPGAYETEHEIFCLGGNKMRTMLVRIIVFIAIIISPVIAFSGEDDAWQFDLAPLYLWAISIDGDMGIGDRTASASIDFGDVWDKLEGTVTLRFNATYREKFGMFVDYNYLDLGKEITTAVGNIEASFTSEILNLAGTYRFLNGPHTLEGVAGIRYTKLDAGIRLRDLAISLDGDHSWVDPIVGLGYNYQISDRWSLRLYGDIGGFGAASDFTWQALALIDYQPWENFAIAAGYRALGTDYETGSGA